MKKSILQRYRLEEQGNESAASSIAPLLINTNICPICQDNLDIDTVSTSCGHTFHRDCIMTWLRANNMCPVCRQIDPFPIGFREERNRRREEIITRLNDLARTGAQPGRVIEFINTVEALYDELTAIDSYESNGGSLHKYMSNRSQKMRRHKKSKSHKKRRIIKHTKHRRY